MKMRLRRISPGDAAGICAFLGFWFSIPSVIIGFIVIASGGSPTLTGFFNYNFPGQPPQIGTFSLLALTHPIVNSIAGAITGYITAVLYNYYCKRNAGVEFEFADSDPVLSRPASDFPSEPCTRCGYTIPLGRLICPNCHAPRPSGHQ